jgi:hypothetical protein
MQASVETLLVNHLAVLQGEVKGPKGYQPCPEAEEVGPLLLLHVDLLDLAVAFHLAEVNVEMVCGEVPGMDTRYRDGYWIYKGERKSDDGAYMTSHRCGGRCWSRQRPVLL